MAWVRLTNKDGQFWDRELGFHLRRGEIRELPDPLPPGSDTATLLRLGGLVICEAPQEALVFAEPVEDVIPKGRNDKTEGKNDKPVRRDDVPLTGPEAPEVEAPVVKPRQKRTIKTVTSKSKK